MFTIAGGIVLGLLIWSAIGAVLKVIEILID